MCFVERPGLTAQLRLQPLAATQHRQSTSAFLGSSRAPRTPSPLLVPQVGALGPRGQMACGIQTHSLPRTTAF